MKKMSAICLLAMFFSMTATPIFSAIDYSSLVAQRGCCSHHGGVKGCNGSGRTICNDGSLSPTCRC